MTTTFNRLTAGAGALAAAEQLNGKPYVYGGTWPQSGGTDCSGLVEWAYKQVGVLLDRTTYQQYLQYPISNNVPLEVGDLLFIAGSDPVGAAPGHVMMYVKPGEVFQAPYTGAKIGFYPYDTSKWEFRTRPALALPMPTPAPTRKPSQLQLTHAGLIALTSTAQANLAHVNGWPVYTWDGHWFVKTPPPYTRAGNRVFYANSHFATKRG